MAATPAPARAELLSLSCVRCVLKRGASALAVIGRGGFSFDAPRPAVIRASSGRALARGFVRLVRHGLKFCPSEPLNTTHLIGAVL